MSVSDLKPQIYFARFCGLDEDRWPGEGQEVHREPDHRRLRVGGPDGEVRGKGRVRGSALLVQIRQGYRVQNVFRTPFHSRNDFGLVAQGQSAELFENRWFIAMEVSTVDSIWDQD